MPAKLEFPLEGYRIDALNYSGKMTDVFAMTLPGHSSAVVKVARELTMKERPSLQNIKDAKTLRAHNDDPILLERTLSPTEWLMEYTSDKTAWGTKAATKAHTYERVVTAKDITYIISAIAPDVEWSEVAPKLKACVDSFELSSAPATGKVAFPQQGYRINKLDGVIPPDAQQPLIEIHGGVHVGIQPYAKTIEEYKAHHEPKLTTFPVGQTKILAENAPAENALVTEFVEEVPGDKISPKGSQVLVFEKVVLVHGQLYYAAGLHWDSDKDVSAAQIKACVESLEAMPVTTTGATAK